MSTHQTHQTHQHPDDWDEPVAIPDIERNIARVLVGFDGSAGAERALAYADLLATLTDAEIVVVVAYDPPVTVRRRGILMAEQAQQEMEEDARELAEEATALLLDLGRRARAIIIRGDAVQAILEAIDSEEASIVVLGRRGLGTLHALVGSVSERIVRHSPVPVLLAT